MHPNESQQAIINAPVYQPLLITAGAGTGKTETIIRRYGSLITQHNLKCEHILLLTFTNKAANEMKERLVRNGMLSFLEKNTAWVHTFHAFCSRLLKEEAPYINISSDFEPLAQSEQTILFQQVYAEFLALEGDFSEFGNVVKHLSLKDMKNFEQKCLITIEKLRDNVIFPDEYRTLCADTDNQKAYALKKIIGTLYKRFDAMMAENSCKDFSKLIADVIRLLRENQAVREKYKNKFHYIMVDEFQDTNHAQYQLLRLLAQSQCANLTLVGDKRQAIYQWRGADPGNIDDFEKSINTISLKSMTINYRSCPSIVKYANRFLDGSPYAHMEDISSYLPYDTVSEPVITLFEHDVSEAEYAASEIAALLKKGYVPSDIVLLFRTVKNRAKLFEKALAHRGIPFYTSGSNIFFDRSEIHDLIAYFKLIVNPFDKNALIRILLRPPYGLSDAQLYALQKESEKNSSSFFEAVSMKKELAHLSKSILDLYGSAEALSLPDVYFAVCKHTRFLFGAYMDKSQSINVRESLSRMVALLQRFSTKNQGHGMAEFLDYFAYALHSEQDSEELELLQASNCVRLMTLHRAKGLEFPCVFLSDIKIPAFSSLNSDFKRRIATEQSFLFDKTFEHVHFKGMEGYDKLKEELVAEQINESIRLYYVGITRARDRLYITGKDVDAFRAPLITSPDIQWKETFEIPEVYSEPPNSKNEGIEEIISQAYRIKRRIASGKKTPVRVPVIRFSCSSLQELEKNPYEYYLRHILHVPVIVENMPKTGNNIQWKELGTLIHETIEEFHAASRQTTLLQIAFEKSRDNVVLKKYRNLIEEPLKYYETLEYSTHNAAGFYAEFPFTVTYETPEVSIELNGQIDRLYIQNEHCKILDFKTGFLGSRDDYILQMASYAFACSRLFPVKTIETELIFLHQKQRETITFSIGELEHYKQRIVQCAKKIMNKDFKHDSTIHLHSANALEYGKEHSGVAFQNQESYYRHFYELLITEQSAVRNANSAEDIRPLMFNAVASTDNVSGKAQVEFNTETYFLKVRHGDSLHLYTSDGNTVDAELVHVGHHSITVIPDKTLDWNSVTGFKERQDELPYERMKDNLLTFIQREIPLKRYLLNDKPEEISKDGKKKKIVSASLDEYQYSAVQGAVINNDIFIVHGPPGTGKTVTIAHMVKELVNDGKRVMLSALTNRAVDAILRKIVELNTNGRFIEESEIARIGRSSMVEPAFHRMMLGENMSTHCIAALIQNKKIVLLTAASIRPALFWEEFDVGIVDEASQMLEPFTLGVANHVKALILVGDNQQLPPIITDAETAKNGLRVSLFERLKQQYQNYCSSRVVMLKNQYRMNKKLMEFPSKTFYDGELHIGNERISNAEYDLNIHAVAHKPVWIQKALIPNNVLVFLNIKHPLNSTELFTNVAYICDLIVHGFSVCGVDFSDIGIISPYRNEVALLRKSLPYDTLVIDTVDRFQGSDRKVIILSCAQKEGEAAQLLIDPNRLNVALTRAKTKMIIVGSLPFKGEKNLLLEKFITYIKQNGIIIDCE